MNMENAMNILNIPIENRDNLTDDIVKKYYRIMALQYHPDKNKKPSNTNNYGVNTVAKFQEINNAYQYLLNINNYTDGFCEGDMDSRHSYTTILQIFLRGIWKGETNSALFSIIIENIVGCCESKMVKLLEKLDTDTLIKIYDVFFKYKNIFHYSDGFLKYIGQVLSNKIKNDNCIILNPSIDDLFDCNLYKLTENEYTYIVPLWHHELVYDNSGCDLYVQCNPIIAENISIDSDNNIHYFAKYSVIDIFNEETIEIAIGLRKFSLFVSRLYIKPNQTIVLTGRGIPRICVDDIYNVSKRGDIHIHIDLECAL
jgi:hypothetical protein